MYTNFNHNSYVCTINDTSTNLYIQYNSQYALIERALNVIHIIGGHENYISLTEIHKISC